ncbi:alpha/beta fold hydrolase [Longispora albida]|uniref:alpha/beta fold hydrolase n=1 Tax=Longispora albida TaxID=203523 RepID=UPI00035FD347|nr:alpha/beta hydrolase [Longispora albida]
MAISHLLHGSGEHKVIALHGWFGSADEWGSLPRYLDGDRHTYAFLDYRGYGTRKEASGDYTLEEISADTLALADQLGWDRFSLIGHSMGGAAAQRVLADAPDRVRGIVGIAPIPASGFPFDEAGWALFDGAADAPENRRIIIDFTTGNRNSALWLDGMVQHSVTSSARDAFAAYLPAWGRASFVKEIEGKPQPVHLIIGEHDPAVSADLIRQTWLAHYPNADLTVLANAGHYPMHETPVQLATHVERALANH